MSSPDAADVTVVVPFYNSSSTLDRALSSVAAQTMPVDRIIVVDDASQPDESDAARHIVRRYDRAELVTLNVNGGPGEARNKGWDLAQTRWVAFLDADDEWHPDRIRRQMRVIEEAQGSVRTPALVCGVDWQGATPGQAWPGAPIDLALVELTKNRMLVHNPVATSSVLLRSDIPLRFAPGRRLAEDHELWLRIAASGERMVQMSESLSRRFKLGVGDSGLTANVRGMVNAEYQTFTRLYREGVLSLPDTAFGLTVLSLRVLRRLALLRARRTPRQLSRPGHGPV